MKNELHSHKDYTNQTLTGRDASEFNNKEIIGTCFYQEGASKVNIFPAGVTGITFTRCNLDNVIYPGDSTLNDCSTKRIKVQNDLEDWVCDGNGDPTEPVRKIRYQDLGLSIDPANIPAEALDMSIVRKNIQELRGE